MGLIFNNNNINVPPSESGGGGGGGSSDFIGIPRELSAQGVLQMPSGSFSLPAGTTDLDNFALQYAFAYASGITSVDLTGLTAINGRYGLASAFRETGVTSANIPDLVTIMGDYGMQTVFHTCTSLTSISFPKLTTVAKRAFSNAFYNCTSLTSISFPELTTVSGEYGFGNTFTGCTGLTAITFPKLNNVKGSNALKSCFEKCINITDVYFPALTTSSFDSGVGYGNTPLAIFNESSSNPMRGKIHLPSNLSSITWIQNSTGSSSSREQYFGSSYCTVLLDLPATS